MEELSRVTDVKLIMHGNTIFHIKMECDQDSGSFKLRGMETFIKSQLKQGHKEFVSSSGGNAGYSAAMVANKLGLRMTVVAPHKTPQRARDIILSVGADLIIEGNDWYEADLLARKIVEAQNACYVHPFDAELLWEGHSSMVDELAQQIEKPDAIVLSVGGGGLLLGVIQGLKRNGWDEIDIIACETEGASSFYASKKEGKHIELNSIDSIAVSLGARKIAKAAYEAIDTSSISCHVVSDKEAVLARDWFYREFEKEVEPACGAALTVIHDVMFQRYENLAVIACGGIGWDKNLSSQFLKD